MPKSQIEPGCKPQVQRDQPTPSGQRVTPSAPGCRKAKKNNPARCRIERAKKREKKLWAKIARAYRTNRTSLLRRRINIYITNYDVRLIHAYWANLKFKRHLHLPLRQLLSIAHEVNLLRPCTEPVKVFEISKEDGGTREIAAPGILNKTRSMILKSVLSILRDQIPQNACYTGNGGMRAAIEKIKEIAGGQNKWLVEYDIKDFYGSFSENAIIELLRPILDPRAIKYTALASSMNYETPKLRRQPPKSQHKRRNCGPSNYLRNRKRKHVTRIRKEDKLPQDKRYVSHVSHDDYIYGQLLHPTVGKNRRGLPQGFPASPIIAELLVAPSLAGHGVVYADNIIDSFTTLDEVRENDKALAAILTNHRAGFFKLKPHVKMRLDQGADVLGIHVRKQKGNVVVEPTEKAMGQLYDEIWIKPATARRSGEKINVTKLKRKAIGMVRAMPLDNETRFWLKLLAPIHLDHLLRLPQNEIDPESLLQEDLRQVFG